LLVFFASYFLLGSVGHNIFLQVLKRGCQGFKFYLMEPSNICFGIKSSARGLRITRQKGFRILSRGFPWKAERLPEFLSACVANVLRVPLSCNWWVFSVSPFKEICKWKPQTRHTKLVSIYPACPSTSDPMVDFKLASLHSLTIINHSHPSSTTRTANILPSERGRTTCSRVPAIAFAIPIPIPIPIPMMFATYWQSHSHKNHVVWHFSCCSAISLDGFFQLPLRQVCRSDSPG